QWVQGGNVSWTMFHTLGVAPVLGRDFREDEDRVGSPNVVMLSDRVWRDRFSARTTAVGEDVMLNGVRYRVIGIMPPGFEFPNNSGVWTTMQMDPLANRGNHSWQVIGRLKPRTTIEQVRTDLGAIAAGLETQYPSSNTAWGVDVVSL